MTATCGSALWRGFSDGATKPNPGSIGIGVVLLGPSGERVTRQARAGHGCNTEAEARALLAAIACASELQIRALRMHVDNVALVHHVAGPGITPLAHLHALYMQIKEAAAALAHFELRWLPRTQLIEADALARAALGLGPRVIPSRSRKRR